MPDYREEQSKRVAELNKKAKKESAFDKADEQAAKQKARESRADAPKSSSKSPTSDMTAFGAVKNIMNQKYKNQTTDGNN